jgi:hypothetical protein
MMGVADVARWLYRRRWDALCVFALVAAAAELYLRSPWGRQLGYEPDEELVGVYRPNQSAQGVRVNADGHRGADTDWTRPVFVAVGDSNSWGLPVRDDEVWTARLQHLLQRDATGVQVANASHPGHGPYHQLVRLRRALEADVWGNVEGALVRVSIEDRGFLPPAEEELPRLLEEGRRRQRVRAVSRLLPYVANKMKEQFSGAGAGPARPRTTPPDEAARQGEMMWKQQERWWRGMVALARERGVPLVFVLDDPAGHPGMAVLARRLGELEGAGVYLLRLDSAAYGLEGDNQAERWRRYRARFTYPHDPHGNPRQHDVTAQHVYRKLDEARLLASLRRQYARSGR